MVTYCSNNSCFNNLFIVFHNEFIFITSFIPPAILFGDLSPAREPVRVPDV